MTRPMVATLAAMLLAAVPADVRAALADRAQFPPQDHGHLYYATTSAVAPEHQAELAIALKLMVASSTRQPIIERAAPVEVGPGVYRLDLRDLGWAASDWQHVLARDPYDLRPGGHHTLMVRADWLLLELADATESDSYYRLLFGGANVPKTRDQWLDLLQVDRTKPKEFDALRFGLIESQSGVAKQSARWIERHPVYGGYAWGTRDVLKIDAKTDPLEHPDGGFAHDGEEWIVGVPKVSLRSGVRGTLQVYLLSDGKGNVVQEGPVDLVEDTTLFRGQRAVRNPGSCVQCHAGGINDPSTNELRSLVADGVDVYADKRTQQQLEAFHLTDLAREIHRNQDDFQAIVSEVCGCDSLRAVAAFKSSINRYDAPLDLAAAARELGSDAENYRLALAHASSAGERLGARLAGLPHGRTIPRDAWVDVYHQAYTYLKMWRRL